MGRVYGGVLACAVVALIATFYFIPRQEIASAYAPVFEQAGEIAIADRSPVEDETPAVEVPAAAQAPAAEAESVEPVKPVPPPKASKLPDFDPSLQLALVGVPDVGMRSSHTLEAPVLSPKLKKGEKVAVLKRYAPATGPTWIKVQTKNGKTGWVFASVLQEKKSKGK